MKIINGNGETLDLGPRVDHNRTAADPGSRIEGGLSTRAYRDADNDWLADSLVRERQLAAMAGLSLRWRMPVDRTLQAENELINTLVEAAEDGDGVGVADLSKDPKWRKATAEEVMLDWRFDRHNANDPADLWVKEYLTGDLSDDLVLG
jgi:hypothetical protein